MVQGVKEADAFTGMCDLGSNVFDRPRRTSEVGTVINYRDLADSRFIILDLMLFEEMHLYSPDHAVSQIYPQTCRLRYRYAGAAAIGSQDDTTQGQSVNSRFTICPLLPWLSRERRPCGIGSATAGRACHGQVLHIASAAPWLGGQS